MTTVYFKGGKAEAVRMVRFMAATLTGRAGTTELSRGVFYALGFQLLSDITADFVRKAQGGTGEDGRRWKRLSPKTLAYSRRFGPGERSALKKGAGLGSGHRFAPGGKDGLLSIAQLRRWRRIFAQRLAYYATKEPFGQAKAHAAAVAWIILKSEGAQTKLAVFGDRPHEPLRDTGILLNSLSMGQLSGNTYHPPQTAGGEYQIFESLENGIIVGTNVPYARVHNEGDPKKGIPERRFIPRDNEVPQVWLDRLVNVGLDAIGTALSLALSQGVK